MKNKDFDCVEMKHKAAEKVQVRLAQMTLDEQLAYWDERTRELLAVQQKDASGSKAA
jgi:hypothetical protein